jgi:hypothetical protein
VKTVNQFVFHHNAVLFFIVFFEPHLHCLNITLISTSLVAITTAAAAARRTCRGERCFDPQLHSLKGGGD